MDINKSAQDLKNDLSTHRANMLRLKQELNIKDESGNYNTLRLQSQMQNLNEMLRILNEETLSLEEQKKINGQLCNQYNEIYGENTYLINELNSGINNKDAVIAMNNEAFLRKSFWVDILSRSLIFILALLTTILVYGLRLINWTTTVLISSIILLLFLAYVLWAIVKTRYYYNLQSAYSMGSQLQKCDETDCVDYSMNNTDIMKLNEVGKICT